MLYDFNYIFVYDYISDTSIPYVEEDLDNYDEDQSIYEIIIIVDINVKKLHFIYHRKLDIDYTTPILDGFK